MFALAVLHLATPPTLFDTDVWLRIGTGVAALALLPAADALSPALLVWILALLLVAHVLFELVRHERHSNVAGRPEPSPAQE